MKAKSCGTLCRNMDGLGFFTVMQRFRTFFSQLLWGLFSLLITLVIILGVVYTYIELQLPNVQVLNDVHLQVPLRVYTRDGKLIAQYGAKRRVPVTLDQIPKQLIQAVLATEDARYYSHPGVDFIGLIRAVKAVISSGHKVQGASTITMQVARNFFLTRKKTYARKIKEILLALKIDKELSKDKVLELYLNKVYFGSRAYGVAAAARVYYGKTLQQLTLPEMAMIAGLPQAPSRNNPLRNPTAAKKRRNHVLSRMLDVGFITKAQYQQASKAPVTARYHEQRVQVNAPYLAEMVRRVMMDEYGKRAYEIGLKVYTTVPSTLQTSAGQALDAGLLAYTQRHGYRKPDKNLGWPSGANQAAWQKTLATLPSVDQLTPAAVLQTAYQSLTVLFADGTQVTVPWSGLSWARPALKGGYVGAKPERASDIVTPGDVVWLRQRNNQWVLSQIPKVQGALVSMNPQNGAVLALCGGFDYSLSNFNRATQALRQPGSNFKPFIYSAALAKGFTLASVINDAPIVMQDSGENSLWRPRNDTKKFYGPTRLRVGLTKSRNLVSIRLLQAAGVPFALNYVRRFGFDASKLPHSLSLALGSGTVTPLQIATGYAVFANGGYRVTPYFIDKIIGPDDQAQYQASPATACRACITNPDAEDDANPAALAPEVLTPQNAYLMTQAMQDVIQTGTGRAAKVLGRSDLAGKTGTTNNQVDAWFSGFNANVVTTVWVGFDDLTPLNEYGAQAALPIWINTMRAALQGTPLASMPQPPGISTARIDPKSGLLAHAAQSNAVFEDFRANHVPTRYARRVASGTSNTTVSTTSLGGSVGDVSSSDGDQPLF